MTGGLIEALRGQLNDALASIVRDVERLRGAYVALDPDGGDPPALAGLGVPAGAGEAPPKPTPAPARRSRRPKPAPRPAAQTAPNSGEVGRENRARIVEALRNADGPLSAVQLQERIGVTKSAVYRAVTALIKSNEIIVAEELSGREPRTYAVAAPPPDERPEPEDLEDEADDPEPPPAPEDDPEPAGATAAATNGHAGGTLLPAASALPSAQAGVSRRVQRELDRAEPPLPDADVDGGGSRPTGEALVGRVMDCLEREASKPATLARELVLPAVELAQAFRVAEARGWIERSMDGRYRPTGARPAVGARHDR